jgi:hypothetical protein
MNRKSWSRMDWMVDRWESGSSDRSVLIAQDVRNRASSDDGNVANQIQRQTMRKSGEMLAVDSDPIHGMFSSDSDLERLVSLNWATSVAFFVPPRLVLEVVANDSILLRPDTDVQHAVIARFQSSSALEVDHKPESSLSVKAKSLSPYDSF